MRTQSIHGRNRRFVCENRKIIPVNFTAKLRISRDWSVLDQSTLGRTYSDRITEFVKSLAVMTRMSGRVRPGSRNETVYRLCRQAFFYSSTVCFLTVARRKFSNYWSRPKTEFFFSVYIKYNWKTIHHTYVCHVLNVFIHGSSGRWNTYVCNTIA